jgi:phosphoribosylformylglycinamidine cyclo-ligase
MTKNKFNYKDSGVNITEGQKFIDDIKNLSSPANSLYSLGSIGGFSGYVEIPSQMKEPVYALACDGVGTKMRIALHKGNLSTIGIDLVAMCVNDLIVSGAKPIAFLDYYGCSNLDRSKGRQILKGIIEGCSLAGCDLVGGETAEMPDHYQGENFDLVGFSMGINDKSKIIDGKKITDGDIILGLPSSGFHSNGYSLINKIIANNITDKLLTDLLVPTKIYVKEILKLLDHVEVNGMAHITGGGFEENLSRVSNGLTINIDRSRWQLPKIFRDIQDLGNIETEEMFRVFNCGIGYAVVLSEANAKKAKTLNSDFIEIGYISKKEDFTFKYI